MTGKSSKVNRAADMGSYESLHWSPSENRKVRNVDVSVGAAGKHREDTTTYTKQATTRTQWGNTVATEREEQQKRYPTTRRTTACVEANVPTVTQTLGDRNSARPKNRHMSILHGSSCVFLVTGIEDRLRAVDLRRHFTFFVETNRFSCAFVGARVNVRFCFVFNVTHDLDMWRCG